MMKLHKTATALLSRGVPTDFAVAISNEGYSIKKLKVMPNEDLNRLGFTEDFINKIKKEPRPPIPNGVLSELLYECRYCCCVCRNDSKPIVVHHIIPWETSHSHDKDNLVVLCTEHHDEAHTTHSLTINLTPERLKACKEAWLKDVMRDDRSTVLNIIDSAYGCWDYFNIFRMFELAAFVDINFKDLTHFDYLYTYGFVDENGHFKPLESWEIEDKPKYYWLEFMSGMYVGLYLKEIFGFLLERLPIKILNDIWAKTEIKSNVKGGDIIVVQGAFYFKDTSKSDVGTGQMRSGYRVAKGIRIEFSFDAWYSTSSTAKNVHLKGRQVATVFAIVRELKDEGKILTIRCSAIAIGSCFRDFDNGRFFVPFGPEDYDYDEEEEEEELYGLGEDDEIIEGPFVKF